MLQIIRDKTSGVIAIVIVALLIVTFAFWGVSYYFDQGGNVVAISVNDSKIDLQEYQRTYQNIRRRWQSFLKKGAANVDDELVKKQTLDSLVERELVNQLDSSLGLHVSANQVRNAIDGLQIFHGENGFDNAIYERSVAQLGLSPTMFELKVQEDMLSDQLQSALSESSFVTENEVKLIVGLKNQSRNISYAIIPADKLKEEIIPSAEEIKDFYEKNSRDYLEPEKVKIAYLDLSLREIAKGVEVNDEALEDFYAANRADYDVEEQRKIRHITIKTVEAATAEQIKVATDKAEELIKLLKSGMTFDELAEKHANDPGPKVEISELGYLTKGIMSEEVDDVMFSLAEGEISTPIVTKNSVDVVKVVKIKGGVENTFENAREQVDEAYRLSIAENKFFEMSDQLANLSYEHPDSLEVAAEDLGLKIRQSDYFDRTSQSDPLLSDSKIISASFSEEVLNGNNSEVLEIGDNRVVVLRLLEHKPEQKKTLAAVRERIVTRIKYEQASATIREKGDKALKSLRSGDSPEQVSTDFAFDWINATSIKRDNTGINRSVLRTAFKLGRPDAGKAVYGGTSLGSGDYALVIVNAVNDPDPSSYTKEELEPVRTQLQKLKATTDWTQLVKDIRSAAEINIFADRL